MKQDWDGALRPHADERAQMARRGYMNHQSALPQRMATDNIPPSAGARRPPPPSAPPIQKQATNQNQAPTRRSDESAHKPPRPPVARNGVGARGRTMPRPPTTPVRPPQPSSASFMEPASYTDIVLELPIQQIPHQFRRSSQTAPTTHAPSAPTKALPTPIPSVPIPARPPSRTTPLTLPTPTVPQEHAELPLPPGICPTCRGAGYLRLDVPVGHPSFGKAIICSCKEQVIEQRRREELWKLSSLDAFQDMTFASFNARVPNVREAFEATRHYAANPDGWLVLSGPCGCGKTHLAAAIANTQFEQGTLVLFAVVPQLLDHLRAAFAPHSNTTYDALFEKVCTASMLILDDLGAEHATPWAQEKLFQIINHRYMYHLPTVITTNLESIGDLDPRIHSRLTDIQIVQYVRINSGDYRPRNTRTRT